MLLVSYPKNVLEYPTRGGEGVQSSVTEEPPALLPFTYQAQPAGRNNSQRGNMQPVFLVGGAGP